MVSIDHLSIVKHHSLINTMLHWVWSYEIILNDNGGEFSADEIDVSVILNVEACTTDAYSPFQNGLCK